MAKQAQRKIVVLASLVAVLTITSALLLVLAPPPLGTQSSYDALWASDGGTHLIDAIFQTRATAKPDHWQYIYIHQSNSASGNAIGSGDHFVIGNGNGCQDGQIQMSQRWNNQLPAIAPAGAASIDPACISICVIGDFNNSEPTPNQTRRLTELVSALQGQLGIGGDKVFLLTDSPGAAGVGPHFPAASLREQILP